MKNIILSLLSVLLVMYTTPPAKQVIINESTHVKKQSIIQPLQPTVHAQKQELNKIPTPAPTPAVQPVQASAGTCADWMAQAGIANTGAANALVAGESGCQAGRLNPSSYACGIAQSLPCTKMYPHATREWIAANKYLANGKWFIPQADPVHELKWMKSYIDNRYGSFQNAYSAWLSRSPHWY